MFIDVSKFFDFETADVRYGLDGDLYYDVLLTSKSTGEVMTFTFDRAHFDELIVQLEENVMAAKAMYEDYRWQNEHKNWR